MVSAFDRLSRSEWEAFADAGDGGLQQRWAYGECLSAMGVRVVRVAVTDRDRVLGIAQIIRWGPGALITRGPIWLPDIDDTCRAEAWGVFRSGLRGAGIRLTAVTTPEERGLGYQVMTPATLAILSIAPPNRARLHGKWRNRLCVAEQSGLSVIRRSNRPGNLRWLFRADRAQQKSRGYRALPHRFTENWLRLVNTDALTLEVRLNDEPIAAMLFLVHRTSATYHIGWSGAQGRARHAHNLLLWRGVEMLAERGIVKIDLGFLDTVRASGLARFKLGTGAVPQELGGTWIFL